MWIAGCVCASVGIGGVFVTRAGTLDPPIGAITSTMTSLAELAALSGQPVGGITTTALGVPRELGAMSIVGGVQGSIEGEDVIGGIPNVIAVYGFSHDLSVPIESGSGLPQGTRTHTPIRVVKQWDSSTPLLYQALVTGEILTDVTLRWYRIDPNLGVTDQYYTVRLADARIVGIRPYTLAVTNESYRHMVEVSFTYSQISWRWEENGNESADTWVANPG